MWAALGGTGAGIGFPSATSTFVCAFGGTGAGIGLPSATRILMWAALGGTGAGIGFPSAITEGAEMVWLPGELLNERVTGSTIRKAEIDNETQKTSFLFMDGALRRPT